MIGHMIAVTQPNLKRSRTELNDWPIQEHARLFLETILEAMPVTAGFNMRRISRWANQEKGGQLTICYWKPAILLFHLELVGQT